MEAPKSKKLKTFAPSLTGRCLRYAVMDLLGFGRLLTDETLTAMHSGASWHKTFQAELLQKSDVIGLEVPIKDGDLGISGRIDAVIEENGQHIAIEYKTVHDEKFRAICQDGPIFDHWAQLALYVNIGGYDQGRLIVDNRETHERLLWTIFPDSRWKQWMTNRIERAREYQQKRVLPPREVSVRCLHCDRWQRCFKSEEERGQAVSSHPHWEPDPPFPDSFFLLGAHIALDEEAGNSN
ncbi:PD-(D/E)XK nuclease family protein [Sulfobacillus thermosulfidooxidans]|uniref:PD-(D/E)XK nuclease family protein n=1 Tax=Sulfobacillus thermosulfidooxidans TaxID=28034 RepID=UPI0006B54DAB|nr:PD-(D/E)XK nuclease family protein [Sulfobacillus thermosulfidooxidans]